MAATKIRREVMTTKATVLFEDGTTEVYSMAGAYTEKRARNVIGKSTGRDIASIDLDYSVEEYEMSLEDFVKHATKRTK